MEINKEIAEDMVSEGMTKNHPPPEGYMPSWMREAMKRSGVVRTEDGKFVKK